MNRSWLVWVSSIAAFFFTAILVITTGPAQESGQSTSTVRRLDTNVSRRRPLSPSGLGKGTADFTAIAPVNEPNITSDTALPVNSIGYQPSEVVQLADPSNYGDRVNRDSNGNPVDNAYIVVLHETVDSVESALNTFQVNHVNEDDQVSYHTLIALDGTIIYVVPPENRAFGAGNSAFKSYDKDEAVFTNPNFPSSVNNFAYHISLETPLDGRSGNADAHSGYTENQYQSLAWLLARTNIPDDRITTHRLVDRSQSRVDPRSFEAERMFRLLRQYPSRQAAQ